MIISQESKTVFLDFEDFYQFMTDLTAQDNNGNNKLHEHIPPLSASRYADMAAHQKALNKDCTCKVEKLLCYCCPTTLDEYVKANNIPCKKCCQNQDRNWRCYHEQFVHPSDAESCQGIIDQIQRVIGNALPITASASMLHSEIVSEDKKKNKRSAHFLPEVTNATARNEFQQL